MIFAFYTLLEAALLFVNAVAILNEERFLSKRKFIPLLKFNIKIAHLLIILLKLAVLKTECKGLVNQQM
jgi:hypothetical protein